MPRVTQAFSEELIKMARSSLIPPITSVGTGTQSKSGVSFRATKTTAPSRATEVKAPTLPKPPGMPKPPSASQAGIRAAAKPPPGNPPLRTTPSPYKQELPRQ